MSSFIDGFTSAFPITLMVLAVLGLTFGSRAIWLRTAQKRSVERIKQVAGFSRGAFTDANSRHCAPPELVEYREGAREGVLIDVFQDGDATVFFRDTQRYEVVKWVHLCRLPKPAFWTCEYGYHLNCVSGTGFMGDGVFCLNCGLDKYPESFPGLYNLRRAANSGDWGRINQLRAAKKGAG